uniref:DNA-directed RNA polymerases I, II, and III subunit RPABC4 n=1 Tax=Ditylenchus dipsaci TaxID=166011 RepID=A0A915CM84_9BILA
MQVSAVEFLKSMALELVLHPGFGGVTPRASGNDGVGFGNPGFGNGAGSSNISSTGYGDTADSTLRSGSSGGGFGSSFTRRTSGAASSLSTSNVPAAPELAAMTYICSDCHGETEIRAKDPIRCLECGYKILYKKRSRMLIIYDGP